MIILGYFHLFLELKPILGVLNSNEHRSYVGIGILIFISRIND